MKNLIHWLMKMSDVRALRQFLRVLNPMMNVVSHAMERTHASFTPFGFRNLANAPGAKHIQNALPKLMMDIIKFVCGNKMMS